MATLSVENLYGLADGPVVDQVHAAFLAQLQNSPSVHGSFFAATAGPPVGAVDAAWVDRVAAALVCSAISRSSLYGFAGTVKQDAADSFWRDQLLPGNAGAIQAGRALYDWAFPAFCQSGGSTFQDYLQNNPAEWAAQLASRVTSAPFINTEVAKLLAQDPDWLQKLNLVFYKLHRLDPGRVAGVVNTWVAAFPAKGIVEQWQSYNFVPSNLFQPDQFLGAVNSAIAVASDVSNIFLPNGAHVCDATYGAQVASFVLGTPRALGITTGNDPNNGVSGCGSCFIAGTPVHLHGGETLPIEQVTAGHKVMARDGIVSEHTEEDVVTRFAHPTAIYGINDLAPFFTPGHLFWTKDGWKAVEPELALDENPDREVGKLVVGDVVFRLKSTDPVAYDEVTVNALPVARLEAGSVVHGLHLSGERSYHAHGFLVAMNYPVITVRRLTQAFATLTPHERDFMRKQLEPLMPLFRKSIGGFVEQALLSALR